MSFEAPPSTVMLNTALMPPAPARPESAPKPGSDGGATMPESERSTSRAPESMPRLMPAGIWEPMSANTFEGE